MAITFDHDNSIINLTAPHTTILLMQDLINAIREEEVSERGQQYDKIANAEGKTDIGGGVVGDITITLLNSWQIKHAAGSYQAILKGGQVVGGLGDNPVAYVSGVQVKMIQSVAGVIASGSGLAPEDASIIAAATWADSNATTLLDNIEFVKAIEGGRWIIDEAVNQMIFYAEDNTTEIARFDLKDSDGNPTSTAPFERVRA